MEYRAGDTSTVYRYVTDAFGKITGLIDSDGNYSARYVYDGYGNCETRMAWTDMPDSTTAALNPFRYNGYYYDAETGLYYCNSRYYDAENGRFINPDEVIAGVGGNLKGYNQFAYCFNDPINLSDANGNWPEFLKNAAKWVVTNVAMPIVKNVQEALSNVDVTCSKGVNISGTPSGFSFDFQAGISIDTKGNVAIQASLGTNVTGGSPGVSITTYQSVTNAPSIDKLEGTGCQIGGSVGLPVVPLAVGGDLNMIPDRALNKTYLGITTNAGFGTPGAEAHAGLSETDTWNTTKFNMFDWAEQMCIKILEW